MKSFLIQQLYFQPFIFGMTFAGYGVVKHPFIFCFALIPLAIITQWAADKTIAFFSNRKMRKEVAKLFEEIKEECLNRDPHGY